MFYLTTHLTTFYLRLYGVRTYGKMTTQIVRDETRCRHMGYSVRLTARVILYAPSHRQDSTYHSLCYTSRGTLPVTRNSLIWVHPMKDRSDDSSHHEQNALTTELHLAPCLYLNSRTLYLNTCIYI